ncbi:protein RecA [Oceaniferula spumae]|uniref:Protein RecA n=2 Tax=Oceaniferula spumae TaxID=2979115 RepID=A0AAT9FJJ1_9BACT
MSTATAKPNSATNNAPAAVATSTSATATPTSKKSTAAEKSASKKSMATKNSNAADDKIAAARKKNLDLAISQIQKDFGETAIMRLGDGHRVDVDVIPTGNLLIDRALGVGGFPRGRIVEIYGPESSGKTTLTLTVIAQAQKKGGLAAFIDVEHALDPAYAAKLGVNIDDLLVSQPNSGEEALQICETLVRSNAIDVVVLDSVAALVTKQELAGEIGDSTVGTQARLMSAAMRKLTAFISKARTTCIFTNQIREKIGVMFGNPETTPGGRALKFFASVRVDIRRIGQIKATDGNVTGSRTRIKVVKNKVAAPFKEAEFDIMYNEGISSVGSMLDLALEFDIVQKRGSWFSYSGNQLAQGRDAAKIALNDDAALYEEIETKVKEAMSADNA